MTQSRVTLVLLSALTATAGIFTLGTLLISPSVSGIASSGISLLLLLGLLIAHRRGWRWSAEAMIVIVGLLTVVTITPSTLRNGINISIFVPTILAAALLTPRWSISVFIAMLAGLAIVVWLKAGTLNAEILGPTFSPVNLVLSSLIAVGIAVTSMVARHAQYVAEQNAREATTALALTRQQANELEQQTAVAIALREEAEAERITAKERLELIELQRAEMMEMSVPVLPLSSSTFMMPLIGVLDTARLQIVQDRALETLQATRARHLIFDITGVPIVDTQVAQGLLQTIQAARLLGAEVVLVGIRPEVAQAVVGLGLRLDTVVTRSTLEDGVAYTMQQTLPQNGRRRPPTAQLGTA